jgi:hypothetical protein
MDRYSAQISPSAQIAENVCYQTLLERIFEYTLRSALARANDRHDWEQDQLRRRGLGAIELLHNGRAVWQDRGAFEQFLSDETRTGTIAQFERDNELNAELLERVDRDLRECWRRAGYMVSDLCSDMKKLFAELESEEADRARGADEAFVAEVLRAGAGVRDSEA